VTMQFARPVFVLVGLGYRREIRNVLEALEFLNDWPGDAREKNAALAACRAALDGKTSADTARFAFIAFALKLDILLEDGGPGGWKADGAGTAGTTIPRVSVPGSGV
jgi:hypothetical protein